MAVAPRAVQGTPDCSAVNDVSQMAAVNSLVAGVYGPMYLRFVAPKPAV